MNIFPCYLYRLYAEDGTLLYIGISCDVEHRVYQHTAIWTQRPELRERLAYWTCWQYPNVHTAEEAERIAIWDDDPLLNVHRPHQRPKRRWTDPAFVASLERFVDTLPREATT